MANWCYIDVKFKAPSNEKAKWLQKGLEAIIDAHDQLNEMACIGGVWIKDCHVAIEEEIDKDKGSCDMRIGGEVKWAITDFDARALAEYLYGHGVDTEITIDYEELGCCLKGTLTVNASKGIMKCKYLKQEDWPWANNPLETQEDWDKFYEELNKALEEKGVTVERETGNILPDKEIMRAHIYEQHHNKEKSMNNNTIKVGDTAIFFDVNKMDDVKDKVIGINSDGTIQTEKHGAIPKKLFFGTEENKKYINDQLDELSESIERSRNKIREIREALVNA